MTVPSAIVIVIDRFGAGYLGPYGNTWIETPALNRLASESLLWENVFADCPTLSGFYRAVGWGRHAWGQLPPVPHPSLIEQLAEAGVQTTLVTDEPDLAAEPFAAAFHERVRLPREETSAPADTITATQMAHTFAAALECVEQTREPFLLWLHLQGMTAAWNAPREFRESLADEDDPPPPEFVDPPDCILPANSDPDEILGMSQAYAGQVLLLDACLAPFLQSIDAHCSAQNALLVVTSPRGYPLGEHGRIGPCGDGLYEEVIHLPLFIRHPTRWGAMQRFQMLSQPADLYYTLGSWFRAEEGQRDLPLGAASLLDLASRDDRLMRECVASAMGEQHSIRTPAWFLRHVVNQLPQLYVKPDDRWEVNEVADRCGDVVEHAVRALTAYEQLTRTGRGNEFPRLPAALMEPPS
jgi:arylsulfatase A-like enzyme